jgi:hypothetical protein
MPQGTKSHDHIAAYDPNHLIDSLIERLELRSDAALSRALGVEPPVISKIRHKRLPIGASILIRMHEASDIAITELREMMGDRREKFRIEHVIADNDNHSKKM